MQKTKKRNPSLKNEWNETRKEKKLNWQNRGSCIFIYSTYVFGYFRTMKTRVKWTNEDEQQTMKRQLCSGGGRKAIFESITKTKFSSPRVIEFKLLAFTTVKW